MATEVDILKAVRTELGDLPEPFRDSFRGNDEQVEFDLSARNIITGSVTAFVLNADNSISPMVQGTDFNVDSANGMISFVVPPEVDARVVVEGTSYGIFSDEELTNFLNAAAAQHLSGRNVQRRFRNGNGFIQYDRVQMELEDLPPQENLLIALLTTIEALWALSTDASMDIDVQTSEGTSLPRGQRWRQLTAQIDLLTEKYKTLSLQMGVGLFAPEVFNLRRVSRSTGRLIPIFESREYDEVGPPIRKLPPISTKDADPDGPENPFYAGGFGY